MTENTRKQFEEGKAAFKKGRLNNPYKSGTWYWKEWQHGQDVAYLDQQKYNKEHGI